MGSNKKDIKRKFRQGGFSSEDMEMIVPLLSRHNTRALRLFSSLSIVVWCVMLVFSLFSDYMRSNSPYYLLSLTFSSVSFYLVRFSVRHKWCLQAGIALLLGSLLLFGLCVGMRPEGNATAYVALLFVMPQLFCVRPLRLLQLMLLPNLVFVPLCIHFKTGVMMQDDIINVLSFSIVAFIIGLIANQHRINEFILETKLNAAKRFEEQRSKALEKQVTIDTLTGMNNFYAYKQMCDTLSDQGQEQAVGILFADLNRLKYTNDTFGHEAGDRYICSFADKLQLAFPDYRCFRIGGDEFKVVYIGQDQELFLQKVHAFEQMIKAEAEPCAAIGYVSGMTDRIEKFANQAEERMYEDKRAFYERFPEFRRTV